MAIPSKEEFEVTIDLLENFNAIELSEEAGKVEIEYNSIIEFYVKIHSKIYQKRPPIYETSVMQWLRQDYGYKLGSESIFGRNALSRTKEEWQDFGIESAKLMAAKILDKYQYVQNDEELDTANYIIGKGVAGDYLFVDGYSQVHTAEQYNSYLKDRFHCKLRNDCKSSAGFWLKGFIIALRDYFYTDSICTNSQKYENDKHVLSILESVQSELSPEDSRMWLLSSEVARAIQYLSWDIELEEAKAKPIKSNNSTAKERLYIHKLWEQLDSMGLGSKISALCDFLTIEGIEHRLDRRTIERNVRKWRQEKEHYLAVAKGIAEASGATTPF